MSYEAVGDYLSKTNRSPGQKVSSSSTFLLQQIAKEEKTKEQKSSSSPEEISVERVEQIPKKLFGEEVNKEIDYVKDLLKMQVEEESDVAGTSGFPSQFLANSTIFARAKRAHFTPSISSLILSTI